MEPKVEPKVAPDAEDMMHSEVAMAQKLSAQMEKEANDQKAYEALSSEICQQQAKKEAKAYNVFRVFHVQSLANYLNINDLEEVFE